MHISGQKGHIEYVVIIGILHTIRPCLFDKVGQGHHIRQLLTECEVIINNAGISVYDSHIPGSRSQNGKVKSRVQTDLERVDLRARIHARIIEDGCRRKAVRPARIATEVQIDVAIHRRECHHCVGGVVADNKFPVVEDTAGCNLTALGHAIDQLWNIRIIKVINGVEEHGDTVFRGPLTEEILNAEIVGSARFQFDWKVSRRDRQRLAKSFPITVHVIFIRERIERGNTAPVPRKHDISTRGNDIDGRRCGTWNLHLEISFFEPFNSSAHNFTVLKLNGTNNRICEIYLQFPVEDRWRNRAASRTGGRVPDLKLPGAQRPLSNEQFETLFTFLGNVIPIRHHGDLLDDNVVYLRQKREE